MKSWRTKRPVRVGLISLGCAKNLVDAEIMLGSLLKDGVEITNDAAQADVVVVNTCSFIDSAQEESVDAILESAEVREANNAGQVSKSRNPLFKVRGSSSSVKSTTEDGKFKVQGSRFKVQSSESATRGPS